MSYTPDRPMHLQTVRLLAVLFMLLPLLLPVGAAGAEEKQLHPPGPRDTCPVCGMFVARYPEWIGAVTYRDQTTHYFDGAKDLFKYLLDMDKWSQGRRKEEISTIWVTEYYSLELQDAGQALYVIGSDVLGPMGNELIPLKSREDADEFMKDHKGKRIVRFDEVNMDMLIKLDNGIFE